jgi:carbon storage regulator
VLVLRRRVGERIAIGAGIEIEVVEISRSRVKLGITAPRNVSVSRKEMVTVAVENRKALEFIAGGSKAVMDTLRFLKAGSLRQ